MVLYCIVMYCDVVYIGCENVLKRLTIIGVILSFRTMAQEALEEVRNDTENVHYCIIHLHTGKTYIHIYSRLQFSQHTETGSEG